MIKDIVLWPNHDLKTKSLPVEESEFGTDDLNQLITDLWDTLFDSGGVGLSAIQIGVPKRVFVMDIGKRSVVFVNPKPLGFKGTEAMANEGCLSLPGIIETVPRFPSVLVEARDDKGEVHVGEYHNLEGQCVQHEYEHLDGITIPDKMSPLARARLAKRMAKAKESK